MNCRILICVKLKGSQWARINILNYFNGNVLDYPHNEVASLNKRPVYEIQLVDVTPLVCLTQERKYICQ